MLFKNIGVYDKVNGAFVVFNFVPDSSAAVRGFILQMASPCDLSFFHDDYELYEVGMIDDTGKYTEYLSRKLLLTGAQAYKAMQDYHLDKDVSIENSEEEK